MSYKVAARYGAMGFLGTFAAEVTGLHRGDRVVLRTQRGSEVGDIISSDGDTPGEGGAPDGEVLRLLTAEDENELRRIRDVATPAEMAFCRERIKALELPMKLVDAEHLLGGEKIIFYFVADGRVDFRQLVKDIAREYKTRIELRQIGVRDEARLLSELGHCGQCLCCKSFMKSLEPVTMRMAKSQKATLDPTKISGVCGRLMCCLRYEDKVYSELKAKMPKRGSVVSTRKVTGKVVDMDVLAQVVSIRTNESTLVRVPAGEIVRVEGQATVEPDEEDSAAGGSNVAAEPAGRVEKPSQEKAPEHQDRPQRRGRHSRRRRGGNRQNG